MTSTKLQKISKKIAAPKFAELRGKSSADVKHLLETDQVPTELANEYGALQLEKLKAKDCSNPYRVNGWTYVATFGGAKPKAKAKSKAAKAAKPSREELVNQLNAIMAQLAESE